jgi:prephenate dehydrogenase
VDEPLAEDGTGLGDADAVVLAVPVLAAPALLRRLAPRLGAVPLVTDVGSTKRSIVAAAEAAGLGARFVGSHPLAGDHRSGWGASRAGLFAGARVYLTPGPSSAPEALAACRALWTALGALPEVTDAEAHDRLLAWSSHLPQAVSSALALALARAGVPREALGPGGRDVTRLAGSSPGLWAQVAADNADALLPALDGMEAALRELREGVERGDPAALRDWFASAAGA